MRRLEALFPVALTVAFTVSQSPSTLPFASWAGFEVHLHRGPTLARQVTNLCAHHHRRVGVGRAGGHLREEAHALAERPRLDLEEGVGAARLPVLEGICLI